MNFNEWLKTLPGSPTPTIAAKISGLAGPTLLRHADRGHTSADNTIVIARAFGINPVDALVDCGFLKSDEIGGERTPIKEALSRASIAELLDTVVNYVNESGIVDGKFDARFIANDEIATRRKAKSEPPAFHSVDDSGWSEGYAADSSPEELFPGDDGYHDGP